MIFGIDIDVAITLDYIGNVFSSGDFNYTGDLSENSEVQFNALTWNDEREKPSWQDILDNASAAKNDYYSEAALRSDVEQLFEEKCADLQSQIDALAARVTILEG